MSDTITTEQPARTVDEAVEDLRQIRAAYAEATKDLTEDEYEALVADLTRRVKDGLREHVRRSRGEIV